MRIIKNNITADLDPDATIEVENTSPIFNDIGSRSFPIKLPDTEKNNLFFGFPGRPDRSNRISDKDRIVLIDGSMSRSGVINVISTDKGIDANIGFDESEAYAKISKVNLSDMDNLPIRYGSGDDPVGETIAHLQLVLGDRIRSDYTLFPVLTSYEENEDGSCKYKMILNEHESLVYNKPPMLLARNDRKMTIKIGSELVSVDMPKGYGVTPFIKLHVLIDLIFDYLGFKVIENPLSTHVQLRDLCVLNNCYDTIVSGKIEYKHLMPDCTIDDILSMIWARFGARFFVNSNTKTVRIKFIRDILSDTSFNDYSMLKSSIPATTIIGKKQLKFSAGKSGELTKTDKDTYSQFYKKCNGIINEVNHADLDTEASKKYTYIMDKVTGIYYYRSQYNKKLSVISSSFFDWDKQEKEIEYEEITSPDEQLPIKIDVIPNCPTPFLEYGEYHVNTSIRLDQEMKESQDKKSKLSICFYCGPNDEYRSYYGSVFGYSSGGQSRVQRRTDDGAIYEYDIDLVYHGKYGLVHKFWEPYILFLKHANQQVTQSFNLSKKEIYSFDFSKKILVDGQLYLPDSFNQVIGTTDDTPIDLKYRSLRYLHPYDIENDIQEYIPIPKKYYWSDISYHIKAADKYYSDFLTNNPVYLGKLQRFIRFVTKPTVTEFLYLADPSDTEEGREVLKKYIIDVELSVVGDHGSVTIIENRNIEYLAGVIAIPI